jgi:hypothetical protein
MSPYQIFVVQVMVSASLYTCKDTCVRRVTLLDVVCYLLLNEFVIFENYFSYLNSGLLNQCTPFLSDSKSIRE